MNLFESNLDPLKLKSIGSEAKIPTSDKTYQRNELKKFNKNSSAIKEGLPTLERRNNKTTITNFDEENKFLACIQEKKPFTFKQNSHCESNFYYCCLAHQTFEYSESTKIKLNKTTNVKAKQKQMTESQIKLIQREWRDHKCRQRLNAVIKIQFHIKPIIHRRIELRNKYKCCLHSIIIIQRAVKNWLKKQDIEYKELYKKYNNRRMLYSNIEIVDEETVLLNSTNLTYQIRGYLQQYKDNCILNYEKCWKDYDLKLYKYETTKKDFKDWIVQSDKSSKPFWFNIASLEHSK